MQPEQRDRPIAVWSEKDGINGEEVEALVIILDGPGCSWWKKAGCTMCGYCNDVREGDLSDENILDQMEKALDRYSGQSYIKIFTSGSFLDGEEIPWDVQKRTFEMLNDRAKDSRILVESRPEYVDSTSVRKLSEYAGSLEVAIGLETSSDRIRRDLIHKGFTWAQYEKAGRDLISCGCLLKTYLLMKPPLLGEASAMEDMIRSISDIVKVFKGSRISVNPMNIQANTPVEGLFEKRMYRTPWLWSLTEVLRRGGEIIDDGTHLMSSPTAGGKRRGAHNCGKCDQSVLDSVAEFSISNDNSVLPEPVDCCREEWKAYLDASRSNPV